MLVHVLLDCSSPDGTPSFLYFSSFIIFHLFLAVPQIFLLTVSCFFSLHLNSWVTNGGCEHCLADLGSLEANCANNSRINEDHVTRGDSSVI